MAAKRPGKAAKRHDSVQPTKPGMVVNLDVVSDRDEGPGSLRPICGNQSKALNNVLATQAVHTLWLPPDTPEADRDRQLKAAVAAMMEFKPQDGIEGMMAAQAVGLHWAVMECLRRAMLPEQPSEMTTKLRQQGANLFRIFLDMIAALDRKRGKGTQVVRVERVMIAPGGQAIVGNVQAGATGGGQDREGVGHGSETRGEPHAPPARLAHDTAYGAVLPPMRGQDAGRDALPIASHAERALPDARRG